MSRRQAGRGRGVGLGRPGCAHGSPRSRGLARGSRRSPSRGPTHSGLPGGPARLPRASARSPSPAVGEFLETGPGPAEPARRARSASRALSTRSRPRDPWAPRGPRSLRWPGRPSRGGAETGVGLGRTEPHRSSDPAPPGPPGPGDPRGGTSGVPQPPRGRSPPPAPRVPREPPPSRVPYLVAFSRGTPDAVGDSRGLIHVRRSWGPRRYLPNFWTRLRGRGGRPPPHSRKPAAPRGEPRTSPTGSPRAPGPALPPREPAQDSGAEPRQSQAEPGAGEDVRAGRRGWRAGLFPQRGVETRAGARGPGALTPPGGAAGHRTPASRSACPALRLRPRWVRTGSPPAGLALPQGGSRARLGSPGFPGRSGGGTRGPSRRRRTGEARGGGGAGTAPGLPGRVPSSPPLLPGGAGRAWRGCGAQSGGRAARGEVGAHLLGPQHQCGQRREAFAFVPLSSFFAPVRS